MDFMRNVVFDAAKTTIYGPPGAPEDANNQASAATRHPIAFVFHLLFKCSAFALYFFGSLFGMNVTVMYVTTILLLAFDFWTVKNVTGRLLVGLRWWNEVREDGTNDWKFESPEDLPPDQRPVVASQDSRMFWITMWVTPLIWGLILMSNLLSPLNLLVAVVAVSLNGANLYGYFKCSNAARSKIDTFQRNLAAGVVRNAFSGGAL